MKRRVTVSVVTLGALLAVALTAATVTVGGQQRRGLVADSGFVSLGPNQVLRVSGDGVDQDDVVTLRFRSIGYTQEACSGGVCKHSISSDTTSAPVTVAPNAGLTVDLSNSSAGVRAVVFASSRSVRILFQIVNTTTGAVESVWDDTDIVH